MTYTYGETRLAKARNEHDEAEARALELETRIQELKAQKLADELKELQEARNRSAGIYPVDPNWLQHRREANAEIAAYKPRKAARNASQVPRARQEAA